MATVLRRRPFLFSLSGFQPRLGGLYRAWMRFAHYLGRINTRVLLALVFFLLIVPFGLLLRLLGNDPLGRRWQPTWKSYREPAEKVEISENPY